MLLVHLKRVFSKTLWNLSCLDTQVSFNYQLVSFVPLRCPSFWKQVLIYLNSRKQSIIGPGCLVDVPGLSSVPSGRRAPWETPAVMCVIFFSLRRQAGF